MLTHLPTISVISNFWFLCKMLTFVGMSAFLLISRVKLLGHIVSLCLTFKVKLLKKWPNCPKYNLYSYQQCTSVPIYLHPHQTSIVFFQKFYWSLVDLQCCIRFSCTAKWISYTHFYFWCCLFKDGHSGWCAEVSQGGFSLHFPNG